MAIGASEKLAQEGLRGNRDRLAVGERDGSCIRKIAHDLESMRGAGGLLRQYQTDRWVRMINTKLTDRSEWYKLFNNAGEDRAPLSFPANKTGAKERKEINYDKDTTVTAVQDSLVLDQTAVQDFHFYR